MLATFCLRLAFGLIASLLLFPTKLVNPRFYRAQFLTAMGLTAGATVLLWSHSTPLLWTAVAAIALTFVGAIVWTLAEAPGGRALIVVCTANLATALTLNALVNRGEMMNGDRADLTTSSAIQSITDDFSSAAVLGTSTTAMLIGHSYLIAPAMSLIPLLRLLSAFFIALIFRLTLAAVGVWTWTASYSLVNLTSENLMWLPVRWLVGIAAPLILGWMAWQAAKIRSTQSATGILYVIVICCFLGELVSLLLIRNTGYTL